MALHETLFTNLLNLYMGFVMLKTTLGLNEKTLHAPKCIPSDAFYTLKVLNHFEFQSESNLTG